MSHVNFSSCLYIIINIYLKIQFVFVKVHVLHGQFMLSAIKHKKL